MLELVSELDETSLLVVNKSKFIGLVVRCPDLESLKEKLSELWAEHKNTSHIVYALRTYSEIKGISSYFSDDGEPSGTAGKPLLGILEGNDIINTALIVIRYYGGINLGTGGLVRAYSKAAKDIFDQCNFKKYITLKNYKIILDYNYLDNFINVLSRFNGEVIDRNFDENITVNFKLPLKNEEEFKAILKTKNLEINHA